MYKKALFTVVTVIYDSSLNDRIIFIKKEHTLWLNHANNSQKISIAAIHKKSFDKYWSSCCSWLPTGTN